ncbi:MAG TPA: GrpB family protein [bacterium]|nr:GrpB family protein [bacterium]
MTESLWEQISRLTAERIDIEPYNPDWPLDFIAEAEHLRKILPAYLIGRIEHFGSTAVPGLMAKPIIDMLIEVTSLKQTVELIVPILQAKGYEYIWRPTFGDDPPWYAWFIKRDRQGKRTHHLHMVEDDFPHWERLLFRDYLRAFPKVAHEYGTLKMQLAQSYPHDREKYTQGKTGFICRVTGQAKEYFHNHTHLEDPSTCRDSQHLT